MYDTSAAIDSLFSPFGGVASFRDRYWPDTFAALDGDRTRLSALTGGRAFASIEEVLSVYDGPVMVVGPPVVDATGGIIDRILVSSQEALKWYEDGAALELDFADFFLPGMNHIVSRMRKIFGLPEGAVAKGIVYAAKNGGGFPVHFDAYVNFVFQIGGEKVWRVARNENTRLPVLHYDLADYPYLPDDLQPLWSGEPPAAGLPDGEEVLLRPGSMLFLPRGVWHCTTSEEATLAMNITLGQTTWLDLLQLAVRRRLLTTDSWRALAWTGPDGEATPEVLSPVGEVLGELGSQLASLTPEDLLREGAQPLDPYQETQGSMRRLLSLAPRRVAKE